MSNGIVLWEGPSSFDGAPLVAVLTIESDNPKTGDIPQVWIIRSDMDPTLAKFAGLDLSNCGYCKFRSGGGCYVITFHAPRGVYEAFIEGVYSKPGQAGYQKQLTKTSLKAEFAGVVRFGAYGDIASLPAKDFWGIYNLYRSKNITVINYTHSWQFRPDLAAVAMASVDSPAERIEAKKLGFRTFRTMRKGDKLLPGEILCPGSKESKKRITCERCQLCVGAQQPVKDIAEYVHGPHKKATASMNRHELIQIQ
jgi:hypothetical protein